MTLLQRRLEAVEFKRYLLETYTPIIEAAGFTEIQLQAEDALIVAGRIMHAEIVRSRTHPPDYNSLAAVQSLSAAEKQALRAGIDLKV
jgi:hypothetical protein